MPLIPGDRLVENYALVLGEGVAASGAIPVWKMLFNSLVMVTEPGTRWTYNGGATAVLARLIEKGTGQLLADYAEEKLFTPLGIDTYQWVKGRDGAYIAASGLRLRPRALARIGQMVLDGGRWEGQQVVPEDWLARSFETQAVVDEQIDYGYQWWLGKPPPEGPRWVGAFGNGGQRLQIMNWQRIPKHRPDKAGD